MDKWVRLIGQEHPFFRPPAKLERQTTGFTLTETAVALAILGIVALAFLGSMSISSKAAITSDQLSVAASLARSQLESAKSADYIDYAVPGHLSYTGIAVPLGYSISLAAEPINPTTQQPLPSGQDQGIQKLTVTVLRGSKSLLTVHELKVNR